MKLTNKISKREIIIFLIISIISIGILSAYWFINTDGFNAESDAESAIWRANFKIVDRLSNNKWSRV